jgi:hypothetical protein
MIRGWVIFKRAQVGQIYVGVDTLLPSVWDPGPCGSILGSTAVFRINAILSAAAMNFWKIMGFLRPILFQFLESIYRHHLSIENAQRRKRAFFGTD